MDHIEALKFIIFYCYYLKNKFNDYYKKIIKLTDEYVVKSDFFSVIKNKFFSNFYYNKYDDNIIKEHIVGDFNNFNTLGLPPRNIFLKLFELSFEYNKFYKKEYHQRNLGLFKALVPFFGSFLNQENINLVWEEKKISYGFDNYTKYILDIKKLSLTKIYHINLFFNIISKYQELQSLLYEIGYIEINKIIESSIFDY